MKKTLEPFQERGAAFLAGRRFALLGDDPGLGKTVQAIAASLTFRFASALVICPASVRNGWKQELHECLGVLSGAGTGTQWNIISYDQATKMVKDGTTPHFDLLILDESHRCKTPDSQRTQAILGPKGLARRATRVWCLTGTPILNRPVELWPVIKTLHAEFKDESYAHYVQRYCGAHFDGYGLNVKGAAHLDELGARLSNFMLRRTKKEVYPGRKEPLVEKVALNLTPDDLRAVQEEEERVVGREALLSPRSENYSQMGDVSRLLRLLGEAKVGAIANFALEKLEVDGIEKIAIACHHSAVIESLRIALKRFNPVVYQGGMTDIQKTAAVTVFQDSRCRVFIGQIQAAGTGINGLQTVCSTAVVAEPPWVPGELDQWIGRFDRIGQKEDLVNCYVMVARGTMDDAKVGVDSAKRRVISRLMTAASDPLEGIR